MYRIAVLAFLCIVYILPVHATDEPRSVAAKIFGRLPMVKSLKLSPDGTRLAILQRMGGRTGMLTMSLRPEEKGKKFLIGFKDGEFNWVRWLANERLAVSIRFPAKRFGTETIETRLLAMDWTKQNQINLVQKQKHKANGSTTSSMTWATQFQDAVVSFLPDDPDHILLALDTYDTMNHPDVYKVNIHTADRKKIVRSRSTIMNWHADQKGVVRLGTGLSKDRRYKVLYRKSENHRWTYIADYDLIDANAPFEFVEFSTEPEMIFVSRLDEAGRKAFYKYNTETGEFAEKIAGSQKVDIETIDVDEDGNLRSYVYRDENPQIVHLDKKRKAIQGFLDKQFPGEEARIVSASKDQKSFIIYVTSPQNPGDYYYLNLDSRRMDWIGENYSGLDRSRLSDMTPLTYTARDGLEIPAYLSLPKGKEAKNLPTVILPHGGPASRDYWGFNYWVQLLTTRGYAVLQMNYRGSTGYGAQYESLGDHEFGGKMLEDIIDGARWVAAQGIADRDRLCIMGGSYGGYAALQTVVREPDLFQCAVAFAPITDVRKMVSDMKKYVGSKVRRDYVRHDDLSYGDISPYLHVDKINIPVLLAHGTKDRRVRYLQGEKFARKMKNKGKDILFLKFEDGNHHLSREQHRIRFMVEVEKFLKKHLEYPE